MADARDELDLLRKELDDLDQRLLATAARRNEIVRQIAQTKLVMGAQAPLFDRQRERAVYERTETIAQRLIGKLIPGGPASGAWGMLDRDRCRDCGGDLRDGPRRATQLFAA